jgi:hypothetical protein
MYRFKGKTEAAMITEMTKTKVALSSSKSMKDFIVTHLHLSHLVISIGISSAIGALLMLTASPEQALAWRPAKGQPMVD